MESWQASVRVGIGIWKRECKNTRQLTVTFFLTLYIPAYFKAAPWKSLYTQTRGFGLVCFLLNRIIVVFFFSFSPQCSSPTKRKDNQSCPTKDWTCLFWKHSGRYGGWPPVEEALEGILTLRKVKMSDLQGPFQP